MKSPEECKVFAEFLTNGAVAWLSAGIIAPLFTGFSELREMIASMISVVACMVFLNMASFFSRRVDDWK